MTQPTRKPKRGPILLDLASAMLPCLMFIAAITYTAWQAMWIS